MTEQQPNEALPSTDSQDVVYPLFMLDDTKTLRGIVVTWTLRFNDVLDPEKLQNALKRLLDIGDWRKIGGRLRMRVRPYPMENCMHS